MPIYEYRCAECSLEFEKLVRRWGDPTACPACASTTVEKQISTFDVSTAEGPAPSMGCGAPSDGCGASACGGGSCGLAN
jgi:putative FmdB family regulatory protein